MHTSIKSASLILMTFLLILTKLTMISHQCQGQILDTATSFIPTVVVDSNQRGDSSVDVHLGNVVNLSTDDVTDQKSRVDLSVLSGMVTVNTNKTQFQNGQVSGPVVVTVFGIPVYVGHSTTRATPPPTTVIINKVPAAKQNPVQLSNAIEGRSDIKTKSPRVDKDKRSNPAVPNKPELSKGQLAEILTKMAQKINEQEKVINELKAQKVAETTTRAERSSPVESHERIPSRIIPVDMSSLADTKPKSIGFEQVSEMLRDRRNRFRDNDNTN